MIGKLKFRAELWHNQRIDNGTGGFTRQPVKITDMWVGVEFLEESRFVEYQKTGTESPALITCRKRNLDHNYFFVFAGDHYRIETIDQTEPRYTICSCIRGGAHV